MRKLLMALLLVVSAIALTACGDDDSSNNNSNNGSSVTNVTIAGDGTWQIYTAQGLKDFATEANTNPATNAMLMNDINLAGSASNQWTAIGSDRVRYKGTFNGNGKTISGLYINDLRANDQGLFSNLDSSGVVKNLGLINPNVIADNQVGGIVGCNYGTITASYVSGGTIEGFSSGGIVGWNEGTVTASYNTGAISGTNEVGGVVGANNGGTITAVYNTGAVSGNNQVGGVVGWHASGTVNTAYFINGKVAGDIGIGGSSGTASNVEGVADIEALNGKVDTMNTAIGSNREYEYKPGTDQTKDLPTLIKVVNP